MLQACWRVGILPNHIMRRASLACIYSAAAASASTAGS
jgi:hypothetical protein